MRGAFTGARATNATVARALLPLAQDQLLARSGYPLDISRDGRYLVYIGDDNGKQQLFLRPLADTITQAIPGTADATTPFFSPDGEWIAFFADNKLKKVTRRGGAPIDIVDTPSSEFGATWGTDGNLLYAVGDSALYRVRIDGTRAVAIVAEPKSPARRHALGALRWPALLPDNARALVSTDSGIGVMDLASGDVRIVLPRGRQARYLPTEQLLFDDNEGRARVVGFDVKRARCRRVDSGVRSVSRSRRGRHAVHGVGQRHAGVHAGRISAIAGSREPVRSGDADQRGAARLSLSQRLSRRQVRRRHRRSAAVIHLDCRCDDRAGISAHDR